MSNRDSADNSVQDILMDAIRLFEAKNGRIPVYSELRETCPGHSPKAYRPAIDAYTALKSRLDTCPSKIPADAARGFDILMREMWATLYYAREEEVEAIRSNSEKRLATLKDARDRALEESERLREQNDLLKDELVTAREALREAQQKLADREALIVRQGGDISALQAKLEAYEKVVTSLQEAVSALRKEGS